MTDFAKEFETMNNTNTIIEKKETKFVTSETSEDVRVSIDISVSTAKQYPRDLKKVLQNILFLATQDKDTADNCFYAITSEDKIIRGASIRLAEIITTCYGNIRSSAKMISNDGKIITVQGACWDLENNVAYSIDVVRSIIDKSGKPFSEERQILESMAACSIALRNAIFKVVPLAITARIQNEIKQITLGKAADFETTRKEITSHFMSLGITEKQILSLFGKKAGEELTPDDVFDLRGIRTAIKEKDTTLEQAFSITSKHNAISKASKSLGDLPIAPNNSESVKSNYEVKISSVTNEKGNEVSTAGTGIKPEDLVNTEEKVDVVSEKQSDLFNEKN